TEPPSAHPVAQQVGEAPARVVAAPSGEPFSGPGSLEQLRSGFVTGGPMLFLAIGSMGEIVYVSPDAATVLGFDASEVIGRNAVDFLHPDDLERAIMLLAWRDDEGAPAPGAARFKIRKPDGSYAEVEVMTCDVSDGVDQYQGLLVQNSYWPVVLEVVLGHLLVGASRRECLLPVLNAVDWARDGSLVSICWDEPDGPVIVGTGVPPVMSGIDPFPGTPWAKCRSDGVGVRGSVAELPAALAHAAADLGMHSFWVEPVFFSESAPPATLTLWTVGGIYIPELHASGMGVARNFTELILRWTSQAELLEQMASRDTLTGLANRRVFFEQVSGTERGAVLYCDLDHFKEVNDALGHAAGDLLLRIVARRIIGCVREGDTVARLGGDEFAVVCAGATLEESTEIAERISAALSEPIVIDGSPVSIGATIGIAHDDATVDIGTVELADRALRDGKHSGRAVIRIAKR
ncbi:MAG TPA: sensor domain-containing diguanylate cyclase, partial [Acidimicrobiales bacterium]|nr:sensor domain-containing diguanylate cyclase [Acidimicrobiales bacterium]